MNISHTSTLTPTHRHTHTHTHTHTPTPTLIGWQAYRGDQTHRKICYT